MKKPSSTRPNVKKKAVKHLKADIQGYKKQRKNLSHEIQEDKELISTLRGTQNGRKKEKACCSACKNGHRCKGIKSSPRKRVTAKKKAGLKQRRKV